MANSVKERRKLLKMRVDELAERAKVSPTFIYMIESGDRTPSLAAAGRIARALGTTVDALFWGHFHMA
ncbi:MAG: helix-turn-helix transcriptional regulator [Methanocella sp.]